MPARPTAVTLALLLPALAAADPAAERGRAMFTGDAFQPPFWTRDAYESAWKQWGLKEKPADAAAAARERWGLHPAPWDNDGLPMGLRPGKFLFKSMVGVDCLVCHGGSMFGTSHPGLGNASLDVEALFNELTAADGVNKRTPFRFTRVRGTNEAGGMGVYLLGFRNPDLTLKLRRADLGLTDDLCEDVPAWWLLKKKRSMYYTGGADARSVRSLMQFMMSPVNGPAVFDQLEPRFRDLQAYIYSLDAPKYPLPVDAELAARGKDVFAANCASCHGTYGEKWTYPNKIVPLDEVGTDRHRYDGIGPKFGHAYNESWFAKEGAGKPFRVTDGYQAPPLDGVWATAPYLHNGSVPTVYHLLKSAARPRRFTRSYRTNAEDYDPVKLGWKVTECGPPDPRGDAVERRKVYDTSESGCGNGGHTYGDALDENERMAVIEYLKTL